MRVLFLSLLSLCLLTQSSQAAFARAASLAHFHRYDTNGLDHEHSRGHAHGGHEHDSHHEHDFDHRITVDHRHDFDDGSVVYVDGHPDQPLGAEQVLKRLCADVPAPASRIVVAIVAEPGSMAHEEPCPFRSRVPHPPERPPRA